MQAWTEHKIITKHYRLYKEMKHMIGELVALLKQKKVSIQLFETYTRCTTKGLPKAALLDDKKRNELIHGAKVEAKCYRVFHKRKMDHSKKMVQTLKTHL